MRPQDGELYSLGDDEPRTFKGLREQNLVRGLLQMARNAGGKKLPAKSRDEDRESWRQSIFIPRDGPPLQFLSGKPPDQRYVTLSSSTAYPTHWRESFPWALFHGIWLMLGAAGLTALGIAAELRFFYIMGWAALMLVSAAALAFEWSRVHARRSHPLEVACIILRRMSVALLLAALVVTGLSARLFFAERTARHVAVHMVGA